jgi:hypothetical protein
MQYEDDTFHPSNNEFDDYQNVGLSDEFSESMSFTTVNSNRKKSKKDDLKNQDKGYHNIKIPYGRKEIEIEVYSTSTTPGKPIRDAVTGSKMTMHLVGSLDEDFYFKVGLATGQLKTAEGHVLFFDNPEQFERLFRSSVSQEIKQKWTDKCIAARLRKYET